MTQLLFIDKKLFIDSLDAEIDNLSGGVTGFQAIESRSKCAKWYLDANSVAKVDFPEPEFPKITNLLKTWP